MKMSVNRPDQRLLEQYVACMEEIKKRTEVIECFLSKKCSALYIQTTAESIALQMRKVLELIALSSLIANRDSYATQRKNFAKDWHAKRILQTLEKVNSEFYPVPNYQVVDANSGTVTEIKRIERGYLTKEEFVKLYDWCCDLLHAENPFSNRSNIAERFLANVPTWVTQIKVLLNHHTVQLADKDLQIWTLMQSNTDGKPRSWLFELVND